MGRGSGASSSQRHMAENAEGSPEPAEPLDVDEAAENAEFECPETVVSMFQTILELHHQKLEALQPAPDAPRARVTRSAADRCLICNLPCKNHEYKGYVQCVNAPRCQNKKSLDHSVRTTETKEYKLHEGRLWTCSVCAAKMVPPATP